MKTEEFEEPEHISIHASAKEATPHTRQMMQGILFQSTPPRRRRLILRQRVLQQLNFNPRLREGGD